jgi:Domain of unknown function (DUF5602)
MQSKLLVVLALTGLAGSEAKGALDRAPDAPGTQRRYGAAVAVGKGQARTYVTMDPKTGTATEVGVALDEAALEGLSATGSLGGGGHEHHDSYVLSLPVLNSTPYRFVELNWNPKGHGGPYTAPHFDFHFYRIPLAERDAIDPATSDYATRAANLPTAEQLPAGYVSSHLLMKLTPAQASVPKMGLHWIDTGAPELPPSNLPFTATFIVGSWDGKVIFDEPMITRDFILAQREKPAATEFAVSTSQRYSPAGFYLTGYRLSYDAQWKEYRIALTGLGLGD